MRVCKSRTLWKKGQGEQSLSLGRERIASGQNIDDFKHTPSSGSSRKASGSDVSTDRYSPLCLKMLDAASLEQINFRPSEIY